jgi:hypothetical protein
LPGDWVDKGKLLLFIRKERIEYKDRRRRGRRGARCR